MYFHFPLSFCSTNFQKEMYILLHYLYLTVTAARRVSDVWVCYDLQETNFFFSH